MAKPSYDEAHDAFSAFVEFLDKSGNVNAIVALLVPDSRLESAREAAKDYIVDGHGIVADLADRIAQAQTVYGGDEEEKPPAAKRGAKKEGAEKTKPAAKSNGGNGQRRQRGGAKKVTPNSAATKHKIEVPA